MPFLQSNFLHLSLSFQDIYSCFSLCSSSAKWRSPSDPSFQQWSTFGSNHLRRTTVTFHRYRRSSRWYKCSKHWLKWLYKGRPLMFTLLNVKSKLSRSPKPILFQHHMSLLHTWFPSHIKHSSLTTHWRLAAVSSGNVFPIWAAVHWETDLGHWDRVRTRWCHFWTE